MWFAAIFIPLQYDNTRNGSQIGILDQLLV